MFNLIRKGRTNFSVHDMVRNVQEDVYVSKSKCRVSGAGQDAKTRL